jgi:hypothetical protein
LADLYLDAYTDLYGSVSTTGGTLEVTANAGGAASPGILLRVLALTGAQLPGTLNTVSQSGTAAHDAAITPVYTGSRVVAAVLNIAAGGPAAASGNTAIDAVSDTLSSSSQSYGYGTYESGTTTAATPIVVGSTAASGGGVAALEIQAAGTIATDASSPAVVSSVSVGAGVTGVTTAAFRPPPGSLIVALVAAAGSAFGSASMSVSDSYGLTWTEAVSANATGNGYAGVWVAAAPASLAAAAATLPGGNVGSAYTANVAATGGYPSYSFALASGSLPSGLSLSSSGLISGTPTAGGTSTFTVTVTDSFGNSATSGTQSLTVVAVAPATPYVLSAWGGPSQPPYGCGTTPVAVATREHDWILVVASWTDGEDNALCFVSDNAHNVYRPIGISNTGYMNIQAWMCPNAKAASTVYVSQSAFTRNLGITILDIANMQAGYAVDVQASPVSGSTSSGWTMSVTTTTPDLVIAAGASQAANTSLPGAWSPQASNTFGSGQLPAATTGQVVGWQYKGTPGSVSAVFTASGSGTVSYAGLLIAFQANAAPVLSSSNPAWPEITVQAAFGYAPGNPTSLPTWTDITSRFWSLNGQRGRNFELDELTAADLQLELDNWDGSLSPGGSYGATLITPVRVLADWQGRRYPVASGIITALPQTYDFQRSIVKVSLSDDYSKLPQILLPSCMISEVLYDQPLHLWPLNDAQNAIHASNWSGRSTSVLVPVKGKYGGGVSGNTPSTGFGNTQAGNYPAGLEGSSDTCWGNYTGNTGKLEFGSWVKGTALVNRHDPSLPLTTTGATYEFWALIENIEANLENGAVLVVLTDDKGTYGGGDFLRLVALNIGDTKSPQTILLALQQGISWQSAQRLNNAPNIYDSHWHHYAVTITTGGDVNVYIDGNLIGFFKGKFPPGKPNRLMFGGDVSVNPYWGQTPFTQTSAGGGYFTGLISTAAVHDRVIDHERIQAHYQSGQTGFVGESSGSRIQRVLTWARWAGPQAIEPGISRMQEFNYLNGGYGSNGISGAIGLYGTGGGAFSDVGAQADVTIQDIANSECGFMFVASDGTLTFRERDTGFNPAVNASVGDMDYALNQVQAFTGGLGPWTATASCTLTTSGTWSYQGGTAALMTVTGTPVHADARSETFTARQAGVSMWVMSPSGCYVQGFIDWYGTAGAYISSSTGAATWCPPQTPVQISVPVSSPPGGALTMRFGPNITSSPSTGTQLYFDKARCSPAGFQVPYLGDLEITEDVQYLFNDIIVTRNIDQATYRAVDNTSKGQYYTRVYTRTIYTAEADRQAVVDVGGWLLSAYSQPQLRVSRITVDAAANPELWPFVLGTDIGDVISFQRTPLGGAAVTGVFMVISIEVDWAADKADFTYVLAPIPGQSILTLDDPVYGLIGSTNELGW